LQEDAAYHRTILAIAALVLTIFVSETIYGLWLESRFLIRDGLEWAYDLVIYVLAAASFGRGAGAERRAAFGVAAVLILAGLVTSYQVWRTFIDPPDVEVFSITLSGALIILEALLVAAALFRFRESENPVIEATWLSARNDAVTSSLYAVVVMAARFYPERWPQMAVDLVSVALCWQAGWRILRDLRRQRC
jgi:Co/Zn/Cd efflux system component